VLEVSAAWLIALLLGSDPGVGVGVLRMSGPEGEAIIRSLKTQLEPRFSVHVVELDATGAMEQVSCDRLDRSCLLALGRRLASRYAVIETASAPERTIFVCDLAAGSIVRVLRFRDNDDDPVLPRVVPVAIAQTIRDHHTPPPPITAEEKYVMATLDEPPYTDDRELCEPAMHVCLSVRPDYEPLDVCPDDVGPPPLRSTRCTVSGDRAPPLDLLALLLLGAARRRRDVIDHLAADGRLPADVVRRLRGSC
jgi:hypothetical protein